MEFKEYRDKKIATDHKLRREYLRLRKLREIKYSVGDELKRARLKKGLKQEELAELASMDQSNIAKIEGGTSLPSISTLRRLAVALGAELFVAFKDSDDTKHMDFGEEANNQRTQYARSALSNFANFIEKGSINSVSIYQNNRNKRHEKRI